MASLAEIFGRHTVDQVNYLQYALYFPPHDSDQATKDALERLRSDILDFVRPWTHDHIWQKDGFNLAIVTSEYKDPSYPFLFGVSRFGDCLNDEWLLISLLYEVSRAYKDVVIALSDNDGEILLIEAAEQIPSWLDPSNSDNRVYIAGGQLHLIPLPTTPADIFATSASTHGNKKLRRADAIDYVRGRPKATLASPGVQDVLAQRLRGYPKQANEERHHARTLVYNRRAAYLLMQCPSLLCWAIDTFYLRDPVSLKACSTMKHFPLEKPVDVVLPWTRTTYAQTVNQRFYAPPLFDKVLPRSNRDVDYDAAQLGMKLLCGLEMLACNAAKHPVPSKHNIDDASDVVDEALLLDRPSTLLPEGMTLTQWFENLNKGYSDAALAQLVDQRAALPQDSTQWMDMVPDELEALLAHHNSSTNAAPPSADGMPVDLSDMMAKFEHFLETSQSDVGGVTLPGQRDSDEDGLGDTDDDDDDDDQDEVNVEDEDVDRSISFDVEKFMALLNLRPGPDVPVKEDDDDDDLDVLMEQMDREMATHDKLAGSFARQETAADDGASAAHDHVDEDIDEDESAPVDIQLNLIKNVLESFKGQQGLPGPAGNLLRQFNIALPRDDDDKQDQP